MLPVLPAQYAGILRPKGVLDAALLRPTLFIGRSPKWPSRIVPRGPSVILPGPFGQPLQPKLEHAQNSSA